MPAITAAHSVPLIYLKILAMTTVSVSLGTWQSFLQLLIMVLTIECGEAKPIVIGESSNVARMSIVRVVPAGTNSNSLRYMSIDFNSC